MKQGSFRALSLILSLILLAGMAVFSAFGQENNVALESIIIDSFGSTFHEWTSGSKVYSNADFSWKLDASRFATQYGGNMFPHMTYVPSWPMALYGVNREGRDIQSMGIWGRFDRQGFNWVDIYPVISGTEEPFEIPLPGRVSNFDMWVWGSNLNYYIEAYFRDYRGYVHSVYLGDLAFTGWRNLHARMPSHIPQSRRVQPVLQSLSFVKFRIWTTPYEQVDNFYVYLNQFKIVTSTFESLFDGNELADPVRVQEFWSASVSE